MRLVINYEVEGDFKGEETPGLHLILRTEEYSGGEVKLVHQIFGDELLSAVNGSIEEGKRLDNEIFLLFLRDGEKKLISKEEFELRGMTSYTPNVYEEILMRYFYRNKAGEERDALIEVKRENGGASASVEFSEYEEYKSFVIPAVLKPVIYCPTK
ncbi:MAG: hypothetical protein LBL09_02405 [Oscillospiraceae bacterium]|nr:hypothetical protein [Oscillospiraceae bacterium]